jgi:hypothetical protein
MAITIKQTESAPASYPTTSPAVTLNDVAWQRIEPYIAHRYTPRTVEWIVEGCGEWTPPLKPAAISTVEVWSRAGEWETAVLPASPLGGYWLQSTGPWRFTATVGGGSPAPAVPAAVWEAVKRLAAYLTAKPGTPGARSERIEAGSISIARSRSESWMASALQNSGAADLLRPYRKA